MDIALDFDGVIADTSVIKREYLKSIGIFCPSVNKHDFFFNLQGLYPHEELLRIYEKMNQRLFDWQYMKMVLPMPGCIPSLQLLCAGRGLRFHVITNRSEPTLHIVERWLCGSGAAPYISSVLSSAETRKQALCLARGIGIICDDDIRHVQEPFLPCRIHFASVEHPLADGLHCVSDWLELCKLLLSIAV